jgi:hypothetical protein
VFDIPSLLCMWKFKQLLPQRAMMLTDFLLIQSLESVSHLNEETQICVCVHLYRQYITGR